MGNLQTTEVAEVAEMESIEVAETQKTSQQERKLESLKQEKQELLKEVERLEQQKFEYENQKFQLMLEKNGISFVKEHMEEYGQAITAEERLDVISRLLNEVKVDMGFKPKEVAKQDEYTAHQQKGDAMGMIASKLSKLFK